MFFKRIEETSYNRFKSFISQDLKVYNLFNNGAYDIYYELSRDQTMMIYYALIKDEYRTNDITIDLITFTIARNGDLVKKKEEFFSHKEEIAIISFVSYIYELEKEKTNRLDLYPEIKEELTISSKLSLTELKRRSELRSRLLDIVDKHKEEITTSLKQTKKANSLFTLEMTFYISRAIQESEGNYIGVSFKFNNGGRSYIVDDIDAFLDAYKLNKEYRKGKSVNKLSYDAFDNKYAEVLNYLASAKTVTSSFDDIKFIDVEHACSIFRCLEGEKVTINIIPINKIDYQDKYIAKMINYIYQQPFKTVSNIYRVSKENIDASISLKEDGGLELTPNTKDYHPYEYIPGTDFIVRLGSETGIIDILKFESNYIKELYYFFATSEDINEEFNYVEDIFQKQVLPKISSSLIKAKKVNKDETFNISLYISLDDEDVLHFKTVYDNEGVIVDNNFIESNSYYLAIKTSYLRILESLGGLENGEIEDGRKINTFITSDISELKKISVIYLDEKLKGLTVNKNINVNIKVNNNLDWLGVSMHSEQYNEEELLAILAAYRKKKKFVILNKDYIVLDDEKMSQISQIAEEIFTKENTLNNERVPFFQALKLKSLENDNISIDLGQYVQSAINDISNFKSFDLSKEMNPVFNNYLRDYQYDAVRWMKVLSNNHLSGVLADDMGLGKSIETIAFISTLKEEKPILIVCPKSLIYNWDYEFEKWDKSYKRYVIEGSKTDRKKIITSIKNNKKEIYITSYDSLRNDQNIYDNKDFSLIVIDEAQFIKNASTLKSKAVKTLHSDYRFALTGTPIENSLSDLWSIFDFLMPGYFENENKFMEQYKDADSRDNLKRRVLPFILRRTKESVLSSLPPKETLTILVNMSDAQRALYESYLLKAQMDLQKGEKTGISIFGMMTRLRQICIDPSTFLENYDELSPKLALTLQTIDESIYGGHKVLIFSSFTKVLDHLRYLLDNKNIKSFYINGDTPASLRISMSNDFNERNDTMVMLVSLKAGGTGLNLHGADTVIHLDPWWNIAAENQATDRAHRIGQTRPVTVYKLINYDSVEEKVLKLQEMKKDLVNQVITNGDEDISKLSLEDVKFILGIK